jgi:cytochrome c
MTDHQTVTPRRLLAATLIATWGTLGAGASLAADPANTGAMTALANRSGCLTCHHVERDAKGPEGLPPIGPSWRDVAAKYQGKTGAEAALTQTVLKGSNPYESHWKGKASGLAMPPNAVAITSAEASQLVGWILKLDTK